MLRFLFIFAFPASLFATVWPVGPTRPHTKPSQVAALVADGDTVAIDAGVYSSDVCAWHANNLTLKGVGNGFAKLDAQGNASQGKAIWVIAGNNTTVENIEFTGCAVPDLNGAGIRQEGVNLTVRHCYFHDNEEGILAGDNPNSEILIEYSEFDHNGHGDGYSHNMYINHIKKFTFRYSWTHRAVIGHELKSRAYENLIYCNRISNENGNASREIDLPNGGTAYIIGNVIQQGPNSENSNIIGYGMEGATNPNPAFFFINNTVWNQKSNGSFLQFGAAQPSYKIYNNLFVGAGTLYGTAVTGAVDTASNLRLSDFSNAGLTDPTAFDFRPLCSSPLVNAGTDPGLNGSFTLLPDHSYLHPAASSVRTVSGTAPDIGAYEASCGSAVHAPARPQELIHTGTLIALSDEASEYNFDVYDMAGRLLISGTRRFDRGQDLAALYVIVVRKAGIVVWSGKMGL